MPGKKVYALALLSSLPQSLAPLLEQEGTPPLRPRPIFNVGIHDIPFLASNSDTSSSWIACSTDNVLSTKLNLFDVLVTLSTTPPHHYAHHTYPKIEIVHRSNTQQKGPKLATLKATQRDARRFVLLRDGLRQLPRAESELGVDSANDSDDSASTFSTSSIIEPLSWPRLAYTSFLWWASAGEKRAGLSEDEDEQDEQDTNLLPHASEQGQLSHSGLQLNEIDQPREIALITYFRRLTTLIFTTLADAISRQDAVDETEEEDNILVDEYRDEEDHNDNENENVRGTEINAVAESDNVPLLPPHNAHRAEDRCPSVPITSSDVSEMGLDMWSATDRVFLEELLQIWWGRKADVNGARIKCCGIPIM